MDLPITEGTTNNEDAGLQAGTGGGIGCGVCVALLLSQTGAGRFRHF